MSRLRSLFSFWHPHYPRAVLVSWVVLSGACGPQLRAQAVVIPPIVMPISEKPPTFSDQAIQLDALIVGDKNEEMDYDPTGMDGSEVEMNEPPFSNDLLSGERPDDELADEINNEIQMAIGVSPAEVAAGVNRVNLKGFPTPRLRNGFTQVGLNEVLNVGGMEMILGPITSVTGKASPGGIQNFVTARPRGRSFSRLDLLAATNTFYRASAETSGVLKQKVAWHRLAVGWTKRLGPEKFSYNRNRSINGSVIWRINRAMSTMFQVDYEERAANASPGVPEYRVTTGSKIIGPYMPLADFHAYGPNAGLRKRVGSASLQFEGLVRKRYSVRAGVQGYFRELDEDRWTQGQYILDLARFGGIREPQHTEQPMRALTAQLEVTARYALAKSDHKVTASIDSSHTNYARTQRALPTAARLTLLPADVRSFDPLAPNYSRPDYSPEVYSRFITDRREIVDYTSLYLSERMAVAQGRLVMTAGLRQDFVRIEVQDKRPNIVQPLARDATKQLSHLLGANYILVKGKVLVFANTSSAFEPSTRVDARTGRVQGNETTLGFETGAKALFLDRRISVTTFFFDFRNQNISRRNPLYDDPILDAHQTQPQLVAAGEERFRGGTFEARAKITPRWNVSGKLTYNQAITTASPDLPEEIGRPLSRFPRMNWAVANRYVFGRGKLAGASVGLVSTYISSFVSSYENASRQSLAYPSYFLMSANVGYGWKTGKLSHNTGLGVRNLLDRDLRSLLNRPDAQRVLTLNYSLIF